MSSHVEAAIRGGSSARSAKKGRSSLYSLGQKVRAIESSRTRGVLFGVRQRTGAYMKPRSNIQSR